MIDTIKVKYNVKLPPEKLAIWTKRTTELSSGHYQEKYLYNFDEYSRSENKRIKIKCTYYPIDITKKPLFLIEFSLTKLLLGENFYQLRGIPDAVEYANEVIAKNPNLPDINVYEGILKRIDFCYNHVVGDDVQNFIMALGLFEYPRRKTIPHIGQGVEFSCKEVKAMFYDKYVECKNSMAHGLLRQETSVRSCKAIERVTGKRRATLRDITPNMVEKILNQDLERLKILDKSILCKGIARQLLVKKYGSNLGILIYGLLKDKEYVFKAEIAKQAEMSKKTLDRYLMKALAADVPPVINRCDHCLPILRVDMSKYGEYCPEGLTNSLGMQQESSYYSGSYLQGLSANSGFLYGLK